jgi:hypothetical protein
LGLAGRFFAAHDQVQLVLSNEVVDFSPLPCILEYNLCIYVVACFPYLIELRKSKAHHQFFEIFMKQKNLIETSFNKVLVNNLKLMFYRAFANYF